MTADKLKLFHEEIMQEEQINYSELPIIIKKQIKGFNLLKSKLEKKPDEKLFLMLQNRAIKILLKMITKKKKKLKKKFNKKKNLNKK